MSGAPEPHIAKLRVFVARIGDVFVPMWTRLSSRMKFTKRFLAIEELGNPLAPGGNHLLARHRVRSAHIKAVEATRPHM